MKFWRNWEWHLIASPVSQEVPLIKMVSSSRESWKSAGLDNDAIWGKREKKHESWGLEQDVKWYKQTQTSGWWLVSVAEWWSYPDASNYYHSLHWAQAREPNRHGVLIPWYLVSRHCIAGIKSGSGLRNYENLMPTRVNFTWRVPISLKYPRHSCGPNHRVLAEVFVIISGQEQIC